MKDLLQKDIHLLVDSRKGAERLEVLEGPTGRRSWPDDVKARIVATSFQPGVLVRDVALRNGVAPQHLSTWRRLARDGKLVLEVPDEASFATLVLAPDAGTVVPDARSGNPVATGSSGQIEIEASGVIVRLPDGASADQIAQIAGALGKKS